MNDVNLPGFRAPGLSIAGYRWYEFGHRPKNTQDLYQDLVLLIIMIMMCASSAVTCDATMRLFFTIHHNSRSILGLIKHPGGSFLSRTTPSGLKRCFMAQMTWPTLVSLLFACFWRSKRRHVRPSSAKRRTLQRSVQPAARPGVEPRGVLPNMSGPWEGADVKAVRPG